MTVQHSALTGSNLHEPKGVAAATDNTVAVATSGAVGWSKIDSDNIDTTSIFNTNSYVQTFTFTDVSTGADMYVPVPYAATISKVYTALDGVLGTADAVLTFYDNSGNSMGTVTITQSGSAAGDVDSLTPASNNTFTAGQRMKITSNGASSNTVNVQIVICWTRTA